MLERLIAFASLAALAIASSPAAVGEERTAGPRTQTHIVAVAGTPNPKIMHIPAGLELTEPVDIGALTIVAGCRTGQCALYEAQNGTVSAIRAFEAGSVYFLEALVDGRAYFVVQRTPSRFEGGDELWVTDGTLGGTQEVAEGKGISVTAQAVGNELVFSDNGLWYRTDGTGAGTSQLPHPATDGQFGEEGGGDSPFADGEVAIYPIYDGIAISDGTREGTRPIFDRRVDWDERKIFDFGDWIGSEFFFTNTAVDTCDLWTVNRESAALRLVRKFLTCDELVAAGGLVYFRAWSSSDPNRGENVLWGSDGTDAGTRPLRISPSPLTLLGAHPELVVESGVIRARFGLRGKNLWRLEYRSAVGSIRPGEFEVTDIEAFTLDPLIGTALGSSRMFSEDFTSFSNPTPKVGVRRWFSYDPSRPIVGIPSRIVAKGPEKPVRLGSTVKVNWAVRAALDPRMPTSRVSISRGTRVLMQRRMGSAWRGAFAIDVSDLRLGRNKLTVAYAGGPRVSGSAASVVVRVTRR